MTGSAVICTKWRTVWWELAQAFPRSERRSEAGAEPGSAGSAACTKLGLGLYPQDCSHAEYAIRRTKEHVLRFTRLYHDIRENHIDQTLLSDLEYHDNIFPDIDYRVYA